MKFVVHDYCGHPFQIHLSRNLAMRGHEVTHLYFADDPGPKGAFENRPENPPSLRVMGLTLGHTVSQTALVARRFNDLAYGRMVGRIIQDLNPDAVISGNAPTEAQQEILNACRARNIRFVYWLQDIFSVAVSKLVTKQIGFAGKVVGWYYQHLDRRQFRSSDAIVAITEGFVPLAQSWAGSAAKVSVIENWAPVDDIKVGPKDNDWSRRNGFNSGFTFLYSGTLGRKHNPDLLLHLAEEFGPSDPVAVVVVAQGVSVKQLHDAKAERQINSLKLLPLQPAECFHDVLSTADVLVAMIEADAGTFAVPSKVSSYLCAGRPILLAAPKENLAAQIIERAQAGIVVEPGDEAGFIRAARRLREDARLREQLGANGRAYAERVFDIEQITDKFESILTGGASKQAA